MDRGAWQALYSPWDHKESDMTEVTLAQRTVQLWKGTDLGGGQVFIYKKKKKKECGLGLKTGGLTGL